MDALQPYKLALIIEYEGTRYCGSQIQVGMPTIQGDIERALEKIAREKIRTVFAGRTDAGVHAKGQVVSFSTCSNLPSESLKNALNFYLRPDIAIKEAFKVDSDFNARKDASSREYRYRILNSPTPSPLQRKYAYFVPWVLNAEAMNLAAQCLVGNNDFASFTGPTGRRTVREVYKAEVSRSAEMFFFDIVANSFLPKQVRYITGSLIRVGSGKLTAGDFQGILRARSAGMAGPVAPPHGLYLMKVNYPDNKMSRVN